MIRYCHRIIPMVPFSLVLLLAAACCLCNTPTHGFVPPISYTTTPSSRSASALASSSSSSSSRIEGNQREPTQEELAVMDTMLDKLLEAAPYELPTAVQRAFRVVSSPPFFLRIASRADQATSATEKERWWNLANNLANTVEAVRATATESMEATTVAVETIVQQAAEPASGEFLVPLSTERIAAMREQFDKTDTELLFATANMAEAVLQLLDAWMNKAHMDGMDGMVGIVQKVVQMMAGAMIAEKLDATESVLPQLLVTDADAWTKTVLQPLSVDALDVLITDIQRYLETIVLSLEAGSMQQRVQAEYLKELLVQTEAVKASKQ